jgi:hypothetical protein
MNILKYIILGIIIIIFIIYILYFNKHIRNENHIEYFTYTSFCDKIFLPSYAIENILYSRNGPNLFKGTESGTLISLYRKLNINVTEKSDTYDALGQPYYYIGVENPPDEFKNKWGYFLVYALGFDKKRDTYLTKWQESNGFGNWYGDYIIYSDKRDYYRLKNFVNKDGYDWNFKDNTSKVHAVSLIEKTTTDSIKANK